MRMAVWFLSWNHQSISESNPGASLGTGPYIKLDHLWNILEPMGAKTTGKSFSGTLDPASSKTTPEQLFTSKLMIPSVTYLFFSFFFQVALQFQLMVNWWFGPGGLDFGIPLIKGFVTQGCPNSNPTLLIRCRQIGSTASCANSPERLGHLCCRLRFFAVFFRRNPQKKKKQLPDVKKFHLTYCWMLQKSHKQPNHLTVWDVFFKPVANHGDFSGSQPPSTGAN